jgi:hypothetical protein
MRSLDEIRGVVKLVRRSALISLRHDLSCYRVLTLILVRRAFQSLSKESIDNALEACPIDLFANTDSLLSLV